MSMSASSPHDGMKPLRILVLGGYGFFGARLVARLARRPGLHLTVAGRSAARGRALAARLHAQGPSEVHATVLDVSGPDLLAHLRAHSPDVVIHACGPFQGQPYHVARASIELGAHYIDLADGRAFVTGIRELDATARAAGVAVISGASSVPALSCAAADHLSRDLGRVESIDIGISPGHRTERGLSTVQAILSCCGHPLPAHKGPDTHAWIGHWQQTYPAPVGQRLLSPCDVPDLDLLGPRYPGTPAVRFGGGLELRLLHRSLNLMARLVRLGLIRDWSVHAKALKWLSDLTNALGSDSGAMHVTVAGRTADGQPKTRTWFLVAEDGDGPHVPTLAAAALIRKLQAGTGLPIGAQPCIGLLTLDDFRAETDGLKINLFETEATDA
ncbi:MAG: hypothetical protein RLZZ524_536 [Pseudomonadota bacterium]